MAFQYRSFLILVLLGCASMVHGKIAGNFAAYVGDPDGIAIIASNGKYLSEYNDGSTRYVYAVKDKMDVWTKFLVEDAGNDFVYLRCHSPDHYVQVVTHGGSRYALECINKKKNPDWQWRKLKIFSVDGGSKIAIKCAKSDVFLQRVNDGGWRQYVQLNGAHYLNAETKFSIKSASVFPAKFELLDVTFPDTSMLQNAASAAPQVAKQSTYSNVGKGSVYHTFTLKDIKETSETTTWEHAFGVELNAEFSYGVPLVGETKFSVKLSYNYKSGGSNTVTSKKEIWEQFKVEIPPNTRATASLMIRKVDNASVPFVARFKKTRKNAAGQDVTSIISESGTWRGVQFMSSHISVKKTDLATGKETTFSLPL